LRPTERRGDLLGDEFERGQPALIGVEVVLGHPDGVETEFHNCHWQILLIE
jgi:hypothetical protein